MNCSTPGFPVLHYLPVHAQLPQSCPTFCNPMDCGQNPLSMGFFRQEYWSGLPFLPPGALPDPGTEPNTWEALTIFWSLLKLMSIESVMPSNHLILCSPLLLLPSIFPSIRVFSNGPAQVAKVLELQLQHQSFQ